VSKLKTEVPRLLALRMRLWIQAHADQRSPSLHGLHPVQQGWLVVGRSNRRQGAERSPHHETSSTQFRRRIGIQAPIENKVKERSDRPSAM